jgi:hypothetical protein
MYDWNGGAETPKRRNFHSQLEKLSHGGKTKAARENKNKLV